jgi:hypothetical protein
MEHKELTLKNIPYHLNLMLKYLKEEKEEQAKQRELQQISDNEASSLSPNNTKASNIKESLIDHPDSNIHNESDTQNTLAEIDSVLEPERVCRSAILETGACLEFVFQNRVLDELVSFAVINVFHFLEHYLY